MSVFDEPPPPPNVPEWMVSFGDMMSLLLTFFIMLVSFSEPKKDEKFNALLEQMQKQFGKDLSDLELAPGGILARQASVAKGLSQGRAQRHQALMGPGPKPAVAGNAHGVRFIRPGGQTAIGTVIFFEEGSAALTEDARTAMQAQALAFAGKPQKIEVRGHTSLRADEHGSEHNDNWDLAYQRSRAVMRYLIEEMHLDPARIRLSVAGGNEPLHLAHDPAKMRENPRVELYLLEEVISDLVGTPQERQQRFTDPKE
jgi:chemotaxis protein MotB